MRTHPRSISTYALLVLAAALTVLALAPAALARSRTDTPGPLAPLAVQQARLTGGDGAAGDYFGFSVAVSGDTAIVGASDKLVGANAGQGAAYVFTRTGTTWTQQQRLVAADGEASESFGYSVATDGDTALVGVPFRGVGSHASQGAVFVYTRSGAAWTLQQQLIAADGAASDRFGYRVALSGGTALIAAPWKLVNGHAEQGAAYVYTRSGSTWSLQAEPVAADGAPGDHFGWSVALDGDTAVVGARDREVGANLGQGAAYVFARSGAAWSQQAQLTASDGATGDSFGESVALDGDTALVGAGYHDTGGATNQGSAYVFARSGSGWSQQAQLTASDGAAHDLYGSAVALSGDTALVGAGYHDGAAANQGAVYVVRRSGTLWTQQQELTAADPALNDLFGSSVAASGGTALVGAHLKTIGAFDTQGAAYVYALPCTVTPLVTAGAGMVTPGTEQTFDWGATPTYTFTPGPGALVLQVRVDGVPVAMTATNSYTFPALEADHVISVEFASATPKLVRLTRKTGKRGVTVTLRGRNFGALRGTSVVKFGKTKVTKYYVWEDSRIQLRVPKRAKVGNVRVRVTTVGGTSNGVSFRVKR